MQHPGLEPNPLALVNMSATFAAIVIVGLAIVAAIAGF
jgi:hypothetical protein